MKPIILLVALLSSAVLIAQGKQNTATANQHPAGATSHPTTRCEAVGAENYKGRSLPVMVCNSRSKPCKGNPVQKIEYYNVTYLMQNGPTQSRHFTNLTTAQNFAHNLSRDFNCAWDSMEVIYRK